MPISGSDWVQIEAPADHCAAATGVTSERSSDSLAGTPRQSRHRRPGQLDRGSGFAARGDTLIGPWSDDEKAKVLHPLRELTAEAHTHCPRTRRRFIHSTELSELPTMSASKRWRDRAATFVWRMATSPFSIGVYIAIAIWISFLVNAETGIPAYLLMAAQFLLVIFVDPPKRVAQYRDRRYGRPVRSPNSRTVARVKQHR